jgi:hypothetical protein
MLAHAAIDTRSAAAAAISCTASPHEGPRVPAPIVLRTACGSFVLGRDGSVARVRASPRPGPGRAVALTVSRNRAGRCFVLRERHVVWRSTRTYPNDGTQIAFGPHSFAFAAYRGGVYLTDLAGPEHVVVRGRSLFPLGISSAGDLLVAGRSRIRVLSPASALVRSYGYRTRNGYAFDERLHAGDSVAQLVYRDRFGPVGCGAPSSMSWRGVDLLYTRSGEIAVIDTRTAAVVEAGPVARSLAPSNRPGIRAEWQT